MTDIRVENLDDETLAAVLVAVAAEVDTRLQRARAGRERAIGLLVAAEARLRREAPESHEPTG